MFFYEEKIRIQYDAGRRSEREINYIPLRYILALLLVVLIVPVAGFMLYFLFGNRKLQRKYIRRLEAMRKQSLCSKVFSPLM